MRNSIAVIIVLLLCFPGLSAAEFFGNPSTNIGKKNLVVGLEYSQIAHEYELDTMGLPTTNQLVKLKVTAGLTDWFDIYLEGGGAGLLLDYKENDTEISKNFDSDYKSGLGLGTRLRLINFPNSQTRVFFQFGGFYFKTDDTIEWGHSLEPKTKIRDLKWGNIYAGLGVVKRIEFVDLTFGVGFSEIKWWKRDTIEKYDSDSGGKISKKENWRESYEMLNPVFGFLGLDFVLPREFRVSVQVGLTNFDNYGFSVALSQGLERD